MNMNIKEIVILSKKETLRRTRRKESENGRERKDEKRSQRIQV